MVCDQRHPLAQPWECISLMTESSGAQPELPGFRKIVCKFCSSLNAVSSWVDHAELPFFCSANVESLVLLRRFPRSARCPPAERRTYVGEPLRRLAPDTATKPLMPQKSFGCRRSPPQGQRHSCFHVTERLTLSISPTSTRNKGSP